jgi:hypothetical protein
MLFFKRLEPAAYGILTGLRDGLAVAAACAAALRDADPAIDWPGRVQEWFRMWQSLGWFCRRVHPRRSM